MSSNPLVDELFNKAADEICRLMNESGKKINLLMDENEKLKKENRGLKEALKLMGRTS